MIIFDTDCLSLLNRERLLESSALRHNLERFPPNELFTTIITFEEQMRGWLAFIAKAKTPEQRICAYERLHRACFAGDLFILFRIQTPSENFLHRRFGAVADDDRDQITCLCRCRIKCRFNAR